MCWQIFVWWLTVLNVIHSFDWMEWQRDLLILLSDWCSVFQNDVLRTKWKRYLWHVEYVSDTWVHYRPSFHWPWSSLFHTHTGRYLVGIQNTLVWISWYSHISSAYKLLWYFLLSNLEKIQKMQTTITVQWTSPINAFSSPFSCSWWIMFLQGMQWAKVENVLIFLHSNQTRSESMHSCHKLGATKSQINYQDFKRMYFKYYFCYH